MKIKKPTFKDVLEARSIIKNFLPRTPLYSYPQLNQLLDARIVVKHENYLTTSAFKVRGGINLISHLTSRQKDKGVITASTGNHALSTAYAAKLFNIPATIVMPDKANPTKLKAIRSLGANIIFFGRIFDESTEYAEQLAGERETRFIHHSN